MEPSSELRRIIEGWFEAASKGDVKWRDQHVSRNSRIRIVGTEPSEWLVGQQAYEFLKNEAEAVGGKIKISVDEAEAYAEGNVGWGVAKITIALPNGKRKSPRWSAVFHREDGEWKLVQLHASIGMSNEEAFGDIFPEQT